MSFDRLARLEEIQQALTSVIEECPDELEQYLRRQYHSCLSPVGWHVGHCVYIEALWIRGCLLDDFVLTKELESIYQPELSNKNNRANMVPEPVELVSWARKNMSEHLEILRSLPSILGQPTDTLRQQNYLVEFLINHHAQHLETIAMVSFVGKQISSQENLRLLSHKTNLKFIIQKNIGFIEIYMKA